MAYAVKADLNLDEKRLAELTDSSQAQGVVNENLVTQALDYASGLVDGMLFNRYEVPLSTPVHPIVRSWTVWLARHWLYSRRETMEIPANIEKDRAQAQSSLEWARSGKIDVPGAARKVAATAPAPTGGALESVPRAFGRGRDGLG